jgi:hypothetical protein
MYESGRPFYLYTGRGPSSDALHLGPFTRHELFNYYDISFMLIIRSSITVYFYAMASRGV